jgi:hypothetical protein
MKKLLIVIAVVVVIAAAIALFMQTSNITVEGNSRYSSEEIIAASQLKPEGILFLADAAGAAKRVTAAFPYIETAKVIHQPPDTLLIRVTESEPVAYITCADGTVALVALDGRVLELNPAEPEGVKLTGIMPPTAGISAGESLTGIAQVDDLLGVEDEFAKGLELTTDDRERLSYALEIISELRSRKLIRYVTYLNASILNPQFDLNKTFIVDMSTRDNTVRKIETLIRAVTNMEPGSSGTIDMSVLGEAHYIPK